MRILYVTSDLGGFRGDTYRQFEKYGHNVQFYTVKQPFNFKRRIKAMVDLQRKLRHIDIVFLDYLSGLAYYVSKFAIKNVPMVARCHRFEVYEYVENERNHKRLISSVNAMKRIICVSEAIEERLQKISRNSKTIVIYNGVDTKKFRPKTEFSSSPIDVGSLGFLKPRKGFKMLIHVVHELVEEGFDLRLHIVGKGRQEKELKKEIKDLNAEKHISMEGYIKEEDKPAWYRSLNVYIQNSTSEGHCISILEAMASGLPVLSTNVGGARETLQLSALYSPNKPLELRKAIIKYMNLSSSEINRISFMNRKKVMTNFNLKTQSLKILKVLEEEL